MLRILHTADWHLGHGLHGFSREREHKDFCSWLLHQLVEQDVDALIIAGDIFDSANPPATAQAMYYSFLAQLRKHCPQLEVIVTAGNHDSPSRLEAPKQLLGALGMQVVGTLPQHLDDCVLPIHNRKGEVAAWCAAVPFLRPGDLPKVEKHDDALIGGVKEVYRQTIELAKQKAGDDQAIIATGHAYMVGTTLSELSERKILGGNQHALPAGIFPDDVTYVALGHLHRPQTVKGETAIHYSGSPIPLALDEGAYPHQVLLIELDGKELQSVQALKVPRTVDITRIPKQGAVSLDELLQLLEDLPEGERDDRSPYLELAVALEGPDPALRQSLEEALKGKAARLCRISLTYTGETEEASRWAVKEDLKNLEPDQVFAQCYREAYGAEAPDDLLECFHELLDTAYQEASS